MSDVGGALVHVVLVQPEIAPNTGNVIRLCANTGARLHLVEPLGFALDDAKLRRAGLDYHEHAEVETHASFDAFLERHQPARWFAFTTRGGLRHDEAGFRRGDALVFGRESAGLGDEFLSRAAPERRLRLPMRPESRSLNLSNAVAVAVFEAWRQLGFAEGR